MSNYIPSAIQIKIFCHLPVKSLIRFRSVSKEWKSLIDSSEFNSDYIIGQAQRKRILLRVLYKGFVDDDRERGEYCLIVDDDDSFPQHMISLTYPLSINRLLNLNIYNKRLVGYSHGLLCFTGCYSDDDDCFKRYVIWNPSIRKSIAIDAPYYDYGYAGFGVCPNSLDPKIVKIDIFDVPYDNDILFKHKVWRVEVFTLSGGVWRSPLTKLPSRWFDIYLYGVNPIVLNGFIYWRAYVPSYASTNATYKYHSNAIISFNLTSEEFTIVDVPNKNDCLIGIFELRESLGVVQTETKGSTQVHKVWLMDDVSKSFIMIYTLKLPPQAKVVGFKDNDQLIIMEDERILIEKEDGHVKWQPELVVYDPYLEHSYNLGLHVTCLSFASSYTESLFLLDRLDTLNDDECHDTHIQALTSSSKEYVN